MSEKLSVALVGCGAVARKHIKAIYHNRMYLELKALVDTRKESVDTLLSSCKLPQETCNKIGFYQDHKKMLTEINPDIVIISTPPNTHFTIGMDALKSQSHILMEKPMTLIPKEAEILNKEASSRRLLIAMGHIYRYFPLVQLLKKEIEKGRFGKPLLGDVKVLWGHGQDYYDRSPWRGTWKNEGGVLMNQTIHGIDLINYLIGGNVTKVSSFIGKQTHDMEAEDIGLGILHYENGAFATITGTTSSSPAHPEAAFDILFQEGRIIAGIKNGKPFFNIYSPGQNKSKLRKKNFYYLKKYLTEAVKKYGIKFLKNLGNPHTFILRDLTDAINYINLNDTNLSDDTSDDTSVRVAPVADGKSGECAVETVIALYYSAQKNKTINLPLSEEMRSETFTMKLN